MTPRELKILKLAQGLIKSPYRPRYANGDAQRGYGMTDGKREAGKRILKLFPASLKG